VVIWLRKWNDDGNETKVLPIAQLEIPSQRPNGRSRPNPEADRFRPLRSGRLTPSFTNALLIQQIIARAFKRASAPPLFYQFRISSSTWCDQSNGPNASQATLRQGPIVGKKITN
jgi:hypothetical protein